MTFKEWCSKKGCLDLLSADDAAEVGWNAALKYGSEKTPRKVKGGKRVASRAHNKISSKLLCDLKRVLPKVKNGMCSETIHDIRGVIADCIAQLQA